jgi:PAS domain S-box-containing protein
MTDDSSKSKDELVREITDLRERLWKLERGRLPGDGQRGFRAVFDSLLDAVLIVDGESGRILDANPATTRILGFDHMNLVSQHFSLLFAADDAQQPEQLWEHVRVYGTVLESQDFRRSDGSVLPMNLAAAIIPWRNGKAVVVTLRDITERREVEKHLEEYQRKLRLLAAELAETEERERRRYARELHDRIGQNLAIAKIRTNLVRDLLPAGHEADMEDMTSLLDDMIRDVRSLTFELSPPVLDELGLGPAIEWLVEHFNRHHGLNTTCRVDLSTVLPPELASLLFQATRELLMNVLKHAHASEAFVEVIETPAHELEAAVLDNGQGIDPARLQPNETAMHGFGLFSIRERLRRVNGVLELKVRASGGTEARIRVPLPPESAGAVNR